MPWSLLAPASISKDTPYTALSLRLHLQNWDFVAGSSAAQEAHHFADASVKALKQLF